MKISNKLIKHILRTLTSVAFAFIFIATNVTCIGPGYQPELPEDAEKLKIK